jgi:hypothetical protein
MLTPFLQTMGATAAGLLAGAGVMHLVPRLGAPGRALASWLCRAPGLDVVVTYFTVLPLILGPVYAGWIGLLGAVVGQFVGVVVWTFLHELANPSAAKGPRIKKVMNRRVGTVRNYAAVWWTAWAVPVFWIVRVAEYLVYPVCRWLTHMPTYKSAEWVNVSRHKFKGLVGHDLIWCLYCDWMTGVWSLGTEMLRNIESFWCPIRFDDSKKCANCAIDFPDVNNGWAPADGTMSDVTRVLEEKYSADTKTLAWFGHPVRLTVEGRESGSGNEGSMT